jgi:hypothetical protein
MIKKSRESKSLPDKQSNFLLYTGNDGKVNVEVFLKDETVWLTQKAMAELFGVKIPAISKHMSNIFESGELQKEAAISILETAQKEGNRQVKRKLELYNLDVIISVGYPILRDKGKVSALAAKIKAEQEYEKYRVTQDKNYISDFDKEIKRIIGKKNDDK